MTSGDPSPEGDHSMVLARCPSCGKVANFEFIGQQIWPEEVAIKLGVPSHVNLYVCPHCLSTISEMLLEDPDSPPS